MPFMSLPQAILGRRQISKSRKSCPGSHLSLVLEPPQRAVLSPRRRLLGSSVSSLSGRSPGGQKHQKRYRSSLFPNKLSVGLLQGRKASHCDGSSSCGESGGVGSKEGGTPQSCPSGTDGAPEKIVSVECLRASCPLPLPIFDY